MYEASNLFISWENVPDFNFQSADRSFTLIQKLHNNEKNNASRQRGLEKLSQYQTGIIIEDRLRAE